MAGFVLEVEHEGAHGSASVILVDASWTLDDLHDAVQIIYGWPGGLDLDDLRWQPYTILSEIFAATDELQGGFTLSWPARVTVRLRERIDADVHFPSLLSAGRGIPQPAALVHNELADLAEPTMEPMPDSYVEALRRVSPMFRVLFDAAGVNAHEAEPDELGGDVVETMSPRLQSALEVFAGDGVAVPDDEEDEIDPRLTTLLLDLGMDLVESPELMLIESVVDCLEGADFIHDEQHMSVYTLTSEGERALLSPESNLNPVFRELIAGFTPDEITVALMDAMASLVGRETASELIDVPVRMLDATLAANPELPQMGGNAETVPARGNALRDMWGLQEPSQVNGAPPELNYAGVAALRYAVGRMLGAIEHEIGGAE